MKNLNSSFIEIKLLSFVNFENILEIAFMILGNFYSSASIEGKLTISYYRPIQNQNSQIHGLMLIASIVL